MKTTALIFFFMITVMGHAAGLPEIIVLPRQPSPVEETAAAELAEHLKAVTGRTFPIVPESARPVGRHAFLIGRTKIANAEFQAPFAPDAIAVKSKGGDVILAGDARRGVLYAVYTLLEKYAGVRWYASDATFIPGNPDLSLPELNEIYTPPFRIREIHYTDAYKAPFSARLKNNGHFVKLPANYGGNEAIIGFCHTFQQILPATKYFKDHPEWYSMQNGKRSMARWHQLCLSNQEMCAEFVKNCLQMIARHPGMRVISISQNDGLGRCECPECLKVEAEEGAAASGPLIRFVNAVAAEIGKVYPDILVDTLAYSYTRTAPKLTKPAKNVSIRYCDIEADFSKPIASGKANIPICRDITAWSEIAPNMFVWHYVSDFGNPLMPYPSFMNYRKDINFYRDHHAIAMFLEGDTYTSLMDFSRMRAWVLAHLLWDPSLDQEVLMDDFLNGYYGAGGRHLRKYLDWLAELHRQSGRTLSCFSRKTVDWLPIEKIAEGREFYENALAAVGENKILTERIKRSRVSLDTAALQQYPYLQSIGRIGIFPDDKWREMAEEVSSFCKKEFSPRSRKVITLWNYETRFPEMLRTCAPPPDICKNMERKKFVDYQEYMFNVAGAGSEVTVEEDSNASNGRAAKLTSGQSWFVQQDFHLPAIKGETWKVVIALRMEGAPSPGVAAYAGLNNGIKDVTRKAVSAQDICGKTYCNLVLGPVAASDDLYLYIHPVAASPKAPIYVDRITLIRQ